MNKKFILKQIDKILKNNNFNNDYNFQQKGFQDFCLTLAKEYLLNSFDLKNYKEKITLRLNSIEKDIDLNEKILIFNSNIGIKCLEM